MLRTTSVVLVALLFSACATNESKKTNSTSNSVPVAQEAAASSATPVPSKPVATPVPCKKTKGKKCPAVSAEPSAEAGASTKSTNVDPDATRRVQSKDGDFQGELVGAAAAGSKFSKLQIGMSRRQVEDIIGQPSDQKTYMTGKAWTPFYFGNDRVRMETFYKKEGRLTYAKNGEKLFRITVDTGEDGYQ